MPWRPRNDAKPQGSLGSCWVCGHRLPGQMLNEHHRAPQAAGGDDTEANKVLICPVCHTGCHTLTRYFSKGQTAKVRDMLGVMFPNSRDQAARMMELVREEARAWKTGDRSEFQRVTFLMQRGIYDSLKAIAAMTLNPNSNKPIGVGRLMETVLTKWVEDYMRRQGGTPDEAPNPRPPKPRERPELA